MTIQNRIDAESSIPLEALLNTYPGGLNAIKDIEERRNVLNSLIRIRTVGLPLIENVVIEDRTIASPDGLLEITVRIYKPTDFSESLPGIFLIHGGGMIMGSVETENIKAAMLCKTIHCVVVSVEYRLAPENPHPAPVQDCYEALVWMSKNAKEIGLDTDRLAIVGGSAGGGLAIATSLMARDQEFPKISFQMANYPMIDDRNETPSSKEIINIGIWDFRDEDIEFANRLLQAGVTTELHVYPGAYHASESFAPDAELSKQIWNKRIEALKRALKNSNISF